MPTDEEKFMDAMKLEIQHQFFNSVPVGAFTVESLYMSKLAEQPGNSVLEVMMCKRMPRLYEVDGHTCLKFEDEITPVPVTLDMFREASKDGGYDWTLDE